MKSEKNIASEKKDPGKWQIDQAQKYSRWLWKQIKQGKAKELWPSVEPPRFGQIEEN